MPASLVSLTLVRKMKDLTEKFLFDLQEEYKIIQNKIDKIGEFRFKIRGWSITVLSAAIAGMIASNDIAVFYWVLCFLLPFSFRYLEYEQEVLSSALGKRAITIEYFMLHYFKVKDSKKAEIQYLMGLRDLESTPTIGKQMQIAKSRAINYKELFQVNRKNFFFYLQLSILGAIITFKFILPNFLSLSSIQRIIYELPTRC